MSLYIVYLENPARQKEMGIEVQASFNLLTSYAQRVYIKKNH